MPSPAPGPLDVEALVAEGAEALEAGDAATAQALGERLAAAGAPEGYALQAHALDLRDAAVEAVRCLEAGTAAHPTDGPLWHLLGCLLRDLGRLTEALAALDRARALDGAPAADVALDRARCLVQAGRPIEALRALAGVRDSELTLAAGGVRLRALVDLERWREALHVGLALRPLAVAAAEQGSRGAHDAAELWGYLAVARLHGTGDEEAATADAERAAEWDAWADGVLRADRELHAQRHPAARAFRLLVEGQERDPDGGPAPFYQRFDVVALSPEDALAWVERLEPDADVGAGLRVAAADAWQPRPTALLGVYRASSRYLYDRTIRPPDAHSLLRARGTDNGIGA